MADYYLVIQMLGFATGTVLFIVLALLSSKASQVTMLTQADSNSGLLASLTGLLWNLGNLIKYSLVLCGFEITSMPFRLASAIASSALVLLSTALFMLVASGYTNPWQSRLNRWFRNFSYAVAFLLCPALFVGVIAHNSYIESDTLRNLSAYNLGVHLVAGLFLFRHSHQLPAARSYARAIFVALAALSISLFALIFFVESSSWTTALSVIAQQASIPMALITFAFLSRIRFADVFVKSALLILTAVIVALCYELIVVGPLAEQVRTASPHPAAAYRVVTTILWCGLLLLFPKLRRGLFGLADKYLFRRPDYRRILLQFARASEDAETEEQLLALAEDRIRRALDVERVTVIERNDIELSDDAMNFDLIHLQQDHPARQSSGHFELEFLVPVRVREKVTHLLAIAPGKTGRKLLSDEAAFLNSIAERTGRRVESIRFERERRERQLRETRLQQSLTEAELRALQAQINPHFLFNTLNTIADLISSEPERAEIMTERLAEVFRYVLTYSERTSVSVSEEFDFLKAYLAIEQARFGQRLKAEITIDPAVADEQIPPLILQPIVENAVKHGLSPKREGGRIAISAERAAGAEAGRFHLTVEDDGVGWDESRSGRGDGIGLKNVRERLQTFYEGRAGVSINSEAGRGTRISISLPRQSQQDGTENSDNRRRSLGAVAVEEATRGSSGDRDHRRSRRRA